MGKLRQYNNEIIIGHNVGPSDINSTLYAIKVSVNALLLLQLNGVRLSANDLRKIE